MLPFLEASKNRTTRTESPWPLGIGRGRLFKILSKATGGPSVENLWPPMENLWPLVVIINYWNDKMACGLPIVKKTKKTLHAIGLDFLI